MSWHELYPSGDHFDPERDDNHFHIEDIAHSLALVCRYGGHAAWRYSVAQHSIHVSSLCPPELRLAGLLHDANEAYLGDIIQPNKAAWPEHNKLS